jgi:hypothetical protein
MSEAAKARAGGWHLADVDVTKLAGRIEEIEWGRRPRPAPGARFR